MSINAIHTNPISVKVPESMPEKTQSNEVTQNEQVQKNYTQFSADDVFKYMSATALAPVQAAQPINTGKYVDKNSADRIANTVSDFEARYKNIVNSIMTEFKLCAFSTNQEWSYRHSRLRLF